MEVSGKRKNVLLEVCDICNKNEADGFCKDCNENMCQNCFQHHTIAKPCRDHVLTSRTSGENSEEKCKIHTSETIRYYCRQHDDVGCESCMKLKHDGCKPKLIKDLAKNVGKSTEFNDIHRKIRAFDAEKNYLLTRIENNMKKNKSLYDEALGDIKKFREDINDFLDEAEKNIKEEAHKYSYENEVLVSQLQEEVEAFGQKLTDIRNTLDIHSDKDSGLMFIRMIECKHSIREIEQEFDDIKLRSSLKQYRFQPEQKLSELRTLNMQFGSFKVSESMEDEMQATRMKSVEDMIYCRNKSASSSAAAADGDKPQLTSRQKQPAAENKYPTPDPRSNGFDVGTRIKHVFHTWKGTVIDINPEGYIEVKWDSGGTDKIRACGFHTVEQL